MRELARYLWFVWQRDPRTAGVVGLCRIADALIPLAMMGTWIVLLDRLILVAMERPVDGRTLGLLIAAEGGLAVAGAAVAQWGAAAASTLAERVQAAVNLSVMSTAGGWTLEKIESPSALDALERVRRQSAISLAPFMAVGTIAQECLSVAVFMAAFAWLSPWMVLALVIVALPECAGQMYFGRKARDIARQRVSQGRYLEYLRQLAAGGQAAKEVRAFGLKDHFVGLFEEVSTRLGAERTAIDRKRAAYGALLGSASIAGQYVSYGVAVAQFVAGHLAVGPLVFILRGLTRVRRHVGRVSEALSVLVQEWPGLSELLTYIEDAPAANGAANERPALPEIRSTVRLEGVSFRYPGAERWVLRHVNATFRRGQVTLVIGENGAGKSTLVKLLARLYEPTEGRMLVDGKDVRGYARAPGADRTAVLFQDFVRYDVCASDNIAFGHVASRDDNNRIGGAAQRAGADALIEELPNGYQQMLGRRFGGVNLSGGQWQRLALARAYVRNADLLILDEPTAMLDPVSEARVLRQIAAEAENRVVLVVSHKRATVAIADQVLVISNGAVVEQGTPSELLAAGGRYARWCGIQPMAVGG